MMIRTWLIVSLLGILMPAESEQTADRVDGSMIQATPPVPPPKTAEQICNEQQYYGWVRDIGSPAYICYVAVAQELGWSQQKIDIWTPFLITELSSVLQGESMMCWNIRGGELVDPGDPCESKYQYRRLSEDVGWGQITCILYCKDRGGWLCLNHGYCGSASVLRSPYHSMKPVLLLVDLGRPNGGSDPWCYDGDAVDYHDCWEAPDRK